MNSRLGPDTESLLRVLAGEYPDYPDWTRIIGVANRVWLTPALQLALFESGHLDRLPDDAREYLAFIFEQNRKRNTRLRGQLLEVVRALNGEGLCPTVIKGAVPLFINIDLSRLARITSDLDIGVELNSFERATAIVTSMGYSPVGDGRGFAREEDVGLLELRAGESTAYEDRALRQIGNETERKESEGAIANIPTPNSRAIRWILHDMMKEGDYWRARIDLRHLVDLINLSEYERDLDWYAIWTAFPSGRLRNALETQLLMVQELTGKSIDVVAKPRAFIQFQHFRRVIGQRSGLIPAAFRISGNLSWGLTHRLNLRKKVYGATAISLRQKVKRVLDGSDTGPKL